MIEVLVALLVLALGLLGFAMMQTMSVRFTQSASYRTQAVNLAYDLLDQMRANRFQAAWYGGLNGASFDAGDVSASGCSRPVNGVTVQQSINRWQCQVVAALGENASAQVNYAPGGVVSVVVQWGDERWNADNPDALTSFSLATQL